MAILVPVMMDIMERHRVFHAQVNVQHVIRMAYVQVVKRDIICQILAV